MQMIPRSLPPSEVPHLRPMSSHLQNCIQDVKHDPSHRRHSPKPQTFFHLQTTHKKHWGVIFDAGVSTVNSVVRSFTHEYLGVTNDTN